MRENDDFLDCGLDRSDEWISVLATSLALGCKLTGHYWLLVVYILLLRSFPLCSCLSV